jgi:hypothetical protein
MVAAVDRDDRFGAGLVETTRKEACEWVEACATAQAGRKMAMTV